MATTPDYDSLAISQTNSYDALQPSVPDTYNALQRSTPVTYDSVNTKEDVIDIFNRFEFENPMDSEYEQRMQQNLNTLGTGENQVQMIANNSPDSRETANALTSMYNQTANNGGINLLGMSAVIAHQRADRAERQNRVAETELKLLTQQQKTLSEARNIRNANLLKQLGLIQSGVDNRDNLALSYDKLASQERMNASNNATRLKIANMSGGGGVSRSKSGKRIKAKDTGISFDNTTNQLDKQQDTMMPTDVNQEQGSVGSNMEALNKFPNGSSTAGIAIINASRYVKPQITNYKYETIDN